MNTVRLTFIATFVGIVLVTIVGVNTFTRPAVVTLHEYSFKTVNEIGDFFKASLPHANARQTLVLCDVDETLLKQERVFIGSYAWFNAAVDYVKTTHGFDFAGAVSIVMPFYRNIIAANKMVLVDQQWPELFAYLAAQSIPIVGFTRRSPEFAISTAGWLQQYGLSFTAPYFGADREFALPADPVLYHDGCIYCARNLKGDTIFKLLQERHAVTPYSGTIDVIMFEDLKKTLKCVHEGLKKFAASSGVNINYHAVLFTAMDGAFDGCTLDASFLRALDAAVAASRPAVQLAAQEPLGAAAA